MIRTNSSNKIIILSLAIVLILGSLPIDSFALSKTENSHKVYASSPFPIAKRHLRGAWISTTLNLDWPSKETKKQ